MKQDYQDLLQADVINTVSGLSLISKVVVDSFLSGLNKSTSLGPGMEFSQYRGYNPGDDLRLMDWKMLARSGRYYIKQSEIESPVTVKFVIDSSASMLHEENGLKKIDVAKVLVACLAYLTQKQQDAVGLYALNEKDVVSIYPKANTKQYNRLLLELLQIAPKSTWPKNSIATTSITQGKAKELIFFITDMYEEDAELLSFIGSLKSIKNEVVVFQLLGQHEIDFDYKSNITFEDLESGKRIKVNAQQAKMAYKANLEQLITKTKDMLWSKGIAYHQFRMDQHLGEALQFYLKQRIKLN